MKSKILSVILILSLIVSSSSIVFAAEGIDGEQIIAEAQADIVEDVVGTDDVCDNINETRKDYVVEGKILDVEIPKSGDEEITMSGIGGEEIAMGLPEEVEKSNAVLTDDGTVIYDTTENISVAVQAISQEQDGETFEAVRTMVTIESERAPKEYSFDFDLPKGFSLVMDTDYSDEFDEFDCGAVYILDNQNEIINTIDAPWAKDANGDSVKTNYRIEGKTLIQCVEFDGNSVFPIVADPTSHPTKYKHYYANYKTVKEIVAKGHKSCSVLGMTFTLAVTGYVKDLNAFTAPINCLIIVADFWSWSQFTKVEKKFKAMKTNQWLKTTYTYRWRNQGKNSGYVRSASPELKIVNAKGQ